MVTEITTEETKLIIKTVETLDGKYYRKNACENQLL